MPPAGYLSAAGVQSCLQYLATTYPAICQLIVLPETSVEGRTIRAIKIASGTGPDRHGVLFIGGVHAREVVNPDLLLSFALKLCQAYTAGTGLTFGPKTYPASTVQLIVDALDMFILPLVNPDGRVYVQSPAGDPMWRKNRNPNPGLPCPGVDLNRNYDFLWTSGIGTSANSCTEIFKGTAAFSEPETRNVRHLLDTYPNITCMADVHSYSELVLHPWGDDDNQTTDPAMNFTNPLFDGLRGTQGDAIYREYIPPADLDWFVSTGNRVRDAIAAVRGHVYTVEQGVLLYPTSGTSKDYPYSRHFVDATKRKIYSYTLETATEFQPLYAEALNVIAEVSAGLVEFCLACLCVVEEAARGTTLARRLDDMREFRDREMLATSAGRRYVALLDESGVEILGLLSRDERLRKELLELLRRVHDVVRSQKEPRPKVLDAGLIQAVDRALKRLQEAGSPDFRKAVAEVRRDLRHFRGRTARAGLESASRARAKPRPRA